MPEHFGIEFVIASVIGLTFFVVFYFFPVLFMFGLPVIVITAVVLMFTTHDLRLNSIGVFLMVWTILIAAIFSIFLLI